MFDPEKVERFQVDAHEGDTNHVLDGEVVLASDYDQLLGLYRNLLRDWNQGLNDSRHAADLGLRR